MCKEHKKALLKFLKMKKDKEINESKNIITNLLINTKNTKSYEFKSRRNNP